MSDNNNLILSESKLALPANFIKTGLQLPDNLTIDQWFDIGSFINKCEQSVMWWMGDWWNFGNHKYGERASQALDSDYSFGTWMNAGYVCDKVETSRRREVLSFSHHQEVAALEHDQQDELLELAIQNGWTRRELRNEIRLRKQQKELSAKNITSNIVLKQDKMEDILTDIDDRFDCVIADPPYNVTGWSWDQVGTDSEFIKQTSLWIDIVINVLADKYHLFWFCSPRYSSSIEQLFIDKSLQIQSRIVWHRRNMAMGSDAKTKFIDTWEMILHIGNKELNFNDNWDSSRFDVQEFAVPQTNFNDTKYHPTQKPLALIQWLVEHGSFNGDKILDPFAGSGTTGEACIGLRDCTLIEQDNEYAGIIRKRLNL